MADSDHGGNAASSPADAGQHVQGHQTSGQAGDLSQSGADGTSGSGEVSRAELQKAVQSRAEYKKKAQAFESERQALAEANGGVMPSAEEIAELRALKAEQAEREREAALKRGEFDRLREEDKRKHRESLEKAHGERDTILRQWSDERLSGVATKHLLKADVQPEALENATHALIRGDSELGIRMEFKQDASGQYKVALVDKGGHWPLDPESGQDMEVSTYVALFKERNSFLFRPSVEPGAGGAGGAGGRVAPGGSSTEAVSRALQSGNVAEYIKNRDSLMRR